jgi:hypothetical protein
MRYERHITRKMLIDNPKILYVFGDNMIHQGYGGQAREMRGEPNAVGIPTKKYPGIKKSDYFSDDDFDEARVEIDKIFSRLAKFVFAGGQVVWPFDSIGTGLADLPNKSPKIWKYLESKREALEKLSYR